MTIAITINVNDGVVMAADSATTILSNVGNPRYIYDNANKLFNLYKGLPIGLQTAGLGSIGQASIGILVKDFRQQLLDSQSPFFIDKANYSIQEVAEKFKTFIYDNNYQLAFKNVPQNQLPYLGFIIAGYSTGQPLAEVWRIQVVEGQCAGAVCDQTPGMTGACWDGEGEPLIRLIMGFGTQLFSVLKNAGLPDTQIQDIINHCKTDLDAGFITAPMPIQDAAELADFLVYTAAKWAKYRPGADSIGGDTDIAAITKYEGFKWIRRKHYYDTRLNS